MEKVVELSNPKNQQRTAIVYFGPQREDYLRKAAAEDSRKFLNFIQQPLQAQLGVEKHKPKTAQTVVATQGMGSESAICKAG